MASWITFAHAVPIRQHLQPPMYRLPHPHHILRARLWVEIECTWNVLLICFSPSLKDAFIKISRSEGVGALWSGLSPTLISALPSTIIYFVAYEQFRAKFIDLHYKYLSPVKGSPYSRDIPMLVPLLAGISARILAVTFVSPIELIRTKMQSQKMTNSEMFSTIRQVMQTQGVLGLWRGLPPTILRDVPFSGIYWTSYEYLKNKFNVGEPTFGFSFMAGAISGSVSFLSLRKPVYTVLIPIGFSIDCGDNYHSIRCN